MEANEFYKKYRPAAATVEKLTGIDQNTVLAWMSWESAFATNTGSKYNNLSGIKYTTNADYKVGAAQGSTLEYSGYNSLESFAKDYARVLNKNAFGYPEVIKIAKSTEHEDVIAITKALNKSQYAEDDYNLNTIAARAKAAAGVVGGSSTQEKPVQRCSCGGGRSSFSDIPHSIRLEIAKKVLLNVPMLEPTPRKNELYNELKRLLTETTV